MPKVEESRYDVLGRKPETDSYEGKILRRNLSSRILQSPKVTQFLVYVEDIVYNWFDTTRSIKKQINYRVKKDSKAIDN